MNTPFITFVEDLPISFSRAIIVQDFKTVIICIQVDVLCYFLLNEKGARFKSVQ